MNDKQRMRHTVKAWNIWARSSYGTKCYHLGRKMNWDLTYIEKISFWGDFKIIGLTIKKYLEKVKVFLN